MSAGGYEELDPAGGAVMVRTESRGRLGEVDAIVFDCDGVLIDARRSYDATIVRTTTKMVREFSGVALPLDGAGGQLILTIRRTGGFNSDWDTTYALSLLSEAALERSGAGASPAAAMAVLAELVADFGSRRRLVGHRSVDGYLAREGLASSTIREMKRFLGYPGNPKTSRMAAAFDQLYYGGRLFREVYGFEPAKWYEKGLIERETLFVDREDILRFRRFAGGRRLAIATGRPFVAVRKTLGGLLRYFDTGASVFIGDIDVHPDLAPELEKFRKPSGESLVRAHQKLSPKMMLYVGDSAEDRLMVDDVRRLYGNTLFAGVYGTSFDDGAQVSYFKGTGSDLLVRTLDQMPQLLEMIRR
jgi:phosphoglycolate phosphatase-like HAD superfamily hydrolase